MRPVEQAILASLAEEGEPLSWVSLVNSICPAPAVEIPDAFAELLEFGFMEASGSGVSVHYVITDAGREALTTSTADEESNR